MKIHQHFFLNFLALFAGLLAVASFVGYLTYKSIVVSDYEERLSQDIELLAFELPRVEDMDAFARRIHDKTGLRVTVIAADGTVLAESNTDKTQMENHAGRPEVMEAARQRYGAEIRYSHTLHYDLLYVAKRLPWKGQPVTLRLAIGLKQMFDRYWESYVNLIAVFVVFIVFAFFLSSRMSRRLRYDIAQITDYLQQIAAKNYKAEVKPRYYSEFLQISVQLKNLVKRLRQREKQRRKYTAKLRLINQQRSDILSAISHEFKNPLAAIIGYTETLREDPNVSVKIRQRFLEKVLSNARKIEGMLDRLSFSVKLENNDLQIRKDAFDMADVCQDVAATLGKKYPDREILCDAEPTPVQADRAMMEVVLTNLIDNALKYSDERVEVRLKDGRVSVVDHGMGIPKKELENITSKYYRVVKNTWDNSMGLGLSIVSYILKLHGSELEIESEIAKGSIFSFSLR